MSSRPPTDHAPWTSEGLSKALLPAPRRVQASAGTFRLADRLTIAAGDGLERPEHEALARLGETLSGRLGVHVNLTGDASAGEPSTLVLHAGRTDGGTESQRYRLRILPERVELEGAGPTGAFHGIQTLAQIAELAGRDWPALEIEDAPDFAARGLSYDVSRGKVPTLGTLKMLVDRLAALKANHLELYVEHTFAFEFNPRIGQDCSPLTADEIRELDAYCAARRMDLVPSLASFGHMGFVLSLPEYRHLAEIEATRGWWDMTWRERMHGLTLDATNPESRELLERMYGEFLPLFRSNLVNVSGDETYDLAKGKTRQRAEQVGVGRIYLDHIIWLGELCRRHGKRMMFWADMIKKFPELIDEIPKDAVALNWDYRIDADYDATRTFRDAGLTTFVCPGTWGWNRMLCDMETAEVNIRRHAATGKRYGAEGLLNTEWGDEGHLNLLAGSWHPIYLGAAMAWNAEAPDPATFDLAFGRLAFGGNGEELTRLLRRVVATSPMPRTWPSFHAPLAEGYGRDAIDDAELEEWQRVSASAAEEFARQAGGDEVRAQDLRELEITCWLNALVARRMLLSRRLADSGGRPDVTLAADLELFASECEGVLPEYEAVWLARNKPSCLHEIVGAVRRLANESLGLARK